MKNFLHFVLCSLCFWVGYFMLWKCILLFYHYPNAPSFFSLACWNIFFYGIRLDLSFAAYLTILPSVVVAGAWLWGKNPRFFLLAWGMLAILTTSVLGMADLEIFRIWGSRIDATVLAYLQTPSEAFASAVSSPLLVLMGIAFLMGSMGFWVHKIWIRIWEKKQTYTPFSIQKIPLLLLFLLIAAVLVIPIRGGLQQIPINQSAVCFSSLHFLNQAAINPFWNFFHSLSHKLYDKTNPYSFYATKELTQYSFTKTPTSTQLPQFLHSSQPNIILIIWESLTSKVVQKQKGVKNITPHVEALLKEGIFFERVYAAGNRTDKGIVAILSGYPAQPQQSIIKSPQKTHSLPKLPTDLAALGYNTAFYYGGETEFANMKSYLYQCGFQKIIEKSDFEPKDHNSKWGAHDHVVFSKFLEDLQLAKQPFFNVILTLSSHEPFDIPYPISYTSNPEYSEWDNRFMHAHRYTDDVLGKFIAQAKRQTWWQNTIVIIIGDHGHTSPNTQQKTAFDPANFQIPMLWLGGALAVKDTVISNVVAQTSLPATILSLVGAKTNHYPWAYPFFYNQNKAFYAFNNGVGVVSSSSQMTYDCTAQTLIYTHNSNDTLLNEAKAYLQWSYQDYLDR